MTYPWDYDPDYNKQSLFIDRLNDLNTLLAERKFDAVRQCITEIEVQDTAELLEGMPKQTKALFFRTLPRKTATEVFAYLNQDLKEDLINNLSDEDALHLVKNMEPDDRAAFLDELPAEIVQELTARLPRDKLLEVKLLLGYPTESVGRLMRPDYVAIKQNWTVQQALSYLRTIRKDNGRLSTLFVLDDDNRLADSIHIRELALAVDQNTPVAELMDNRVIYIHAREDQEKAVETMQHYDLNSLPVVDGDQVLVGVVTIDDILDIAEAETTEDFHKMGSVGVINFNISEASPVLLYRKRIGWLLLLVFVNVFAGLAIATFEDTIAAVVALVFFLPLIIGSSGNAGSQASTLMVRSLATGDVALRDWGRLIIKEVSVAAALGITMGIAIASIGYWRGGWDLAAVVALSMVAVVIVGSLMGMSLPFLLSKLKIDPATASAPLITSMADIVGILIYFSIAVAILPTSPPV
ncbi:magnesium transporter [Thiomicrospira sp. ALE5]|uniref:magnesium transporter n=1 Tax=Thiomicrospira sp. ALE5 TaxID=748650 RepID=UPI0008E69321|nr:magnesium transporter [Thiomicrospira sp. ALE5]SFR61051.1 magnesium transporter [Thiomicrospira sp. ALE5]